MRAEVWRARTESPLFDCRQYAQGMEKLYRIMWSKFAKGEKPDHIAAPKNDWNPHREQWQSDIKLCNAVIKH